MQLLIMFRDHKPFPIRMDVHYVFPVWRNESSRRKKPMEMSLHSSELLYTAGTNVRIQDCIWNSSLMKQFLKATGTTQNTGSSTWIWGTTLLWERQSTVTGYPKKSWSFLLWRYLNPAWTWSCAICSGWTGFIKGIGLDDLQSSLPTPATL